MKQETKETPLERRVRTGHIQRRDIQRRLAELAFGRANDCVRLVLEEGPDVDALDLSLLSEVKRNDKGTVEVKLIDRLQALEALSGMLGNEEGEMKAFLQRFFEKAIHQTNCRESLCCSNSIKSKSG